MRRALSVAFCVLFVSGMALGDWDLGDYHKMHYPQLPMVDGGWDVKASYYRFLADDWQCSESGPVTDIHLWVSYKGDVFFDPTKIHTAIWTNDPVGDSGIAGEDPLNTYSKPLEQVWHKDWLSGWTTRLWDTGPQGWYDPQSGLQNPGVGIDPSVEPDHQEVHQINMLIDPAEAFYQEVGEIYWLEFSVPEPIESDIGWKQSGSPQFEDDAVWRPEANENWEELYDPYTGLSMDLAFVITPEPGTILLMLVGLVGLLRRKH